MNIIITNISELASFVGSVTVIGSALMWIYNKFIGKPREERRQEQENLRQEKMLELIKEKNDPLIKAISDLREWGKKSAREREALYKINDEQTKQLGAHEEVLRDHNDRIIILEAKNNIHYKKDKK